MRQDTPNNLPNERPTLAAPAAILIVNGGVDPPGGSWIELCLSQLTRTTPKGSYQVYVWNNNLGERGFYKSIQTHVSDAILFEPRKGEALRHFHAVPLQRMYEVARPRGHHWIVTLDSDAHPVKPGWLELLIESTTGDCVLSGVWRDELSDGIPPYVHASGLCVQRAFIERFDLRFDRVADPPIGKKMDTLSDFTEVAIANGLQVLPWRRSNKAQFHRLIGGIYNDFIYHHGAGSRRNILFWGEMDTTFRRKLNTVIASETASMVFSRYDSYMHFLRSGLDNGAAGRQRLLQWLARGSGTPARRSIVALLFSHIALRDRLRASYGRKLEALAGSQ